MSPTVLQESIRIPGWVVDLASFRLVRRDDEAGDTEFTLEVR